MTATRPCVANNKFDDKLEVARSFLEQRRKSADQRDLAYSAFLQALLDWGVLEALPVDASRTLRVSAPFCHDFFEGPLLLPFLMEHVLDRGHAGGISAFGSDLHPQQFWWRAWEQWAEFTFGPRVVLTLQQQDLEKEQMPQADFILGVHPEITNGGPWPRILENVLRSRSPGGQCVFATFYRQEAEEAARVCRGLGLDGVVRENPHYAGQPETAVGTSLRFAVILARGPGPVQSLRPSAAPSVAVRQPPPAMQPASACSLGNPSVPPLLARAEGPVAHGTPSPTSDGILEPTIRWVERRRGSPDGRDSAYSALLEALAAWGVLQGLPLDAAGALRVSAPFCHEFYEAPLLLPFLAQRLLSPDGASGIAAFGCDVEPQSFWWPAWEAWAAHVLGPAVTLELQCTDLSVERPPPAGLILAVHPEVTKGGPWHCIMRNVLESCVPGGQCIFATFYAQEAREALKICQSLGVAGEVRENPYYAGQPDSVGTFLRYAVIISRR